MRDRQKKAPVPSLNSGALKSYRLINAPLKPASVQLVAQVANKLKALGFVIITAQFGNKPSITVKATAATRQLESVCTGQHRGMDDRMYVAYAAGVDGVKVVWHKLKHTATIIPWPDRSRR
jgi:hypothetical protein